MCHKTWWFYYAFSSSCLYCRQLKKKVNISSLVFFYTWVVLQALSNSSHSSAPELSRECCVAGLSDTDPPASSWLHPLTDHDSLARLMQERRAQQQHSRPLPAFTQKNTGSFRFHTLSFTRKHSEKHNNWLLWIHFSIRCCWGPWMTAWTLRDAGKLDGWTKLKEI